MYVSVYCWLKIHSSKDHCFLYFILYIIFSISYIHIMKFVYFNTKIRWTLKNHIDIFSRVKKDINIWRLDTERQVNKARERETFYDRYEFFCFFFYTMREKNDIIYTHFRQTNYKLFVCLFSYYLPLSLTPSLSFSMFYGLIQITM